MREDYHARELPLAAASSPVPHGPASMRKAAGLAYEKKVLSRRRHFFVSPPACIFPRRDGYRHAKYAAIYRGGRLML